MKVILALDAMGGDKSPDIVIEGAQLALERYTKEAAHSQDQLFFNLYGNEELLAPLVLKYPSLAENSKIFHTSEAITNDMKPTQAIRGMRQSSMRLAIESVASGESNAVVSAGNTGAYMALSKIILKTLDGVDRPAIAATIPTLQETCVALDLGANVDCTADNLVQFSIMGDAIARRILHKVNPSIGLLNVGSEELKGSAVVQQAAQIIRDRNCINYTGFVEGDDITGGGIDVIVTDGFTGNVALKAIEGVAKFVMSSMKQMMSSSVRGRLAYLVGQPVFDAIKNRMDPRLYNGAIFIGLRGIAVKSHGGADGIAFANAIKITLDLAQKMDSQSSCPQAQTLGEEIEEKLRDFQ